MNNYNQQIDENNYSTVNRFLFIIIFFFGHILTYYCIYTKYSFSPDENEELSSGNQDFSLKIETKQHEHKKQPEIPYEEKYLTKVRNMVNEYIFTDEELHLQEKKLEELEREENNKKLESIYILNEKIEELKVKLSEINIAVHEDTKEKSNKDESLIKKLHISIQNEIETNKKKLLDLQDDETNVDDLRKKAKQFIIDEQLKKFNKKYVIEYTPLGNVLMFYNHEKLAFEYYSDLTIPYRYLETVARKYVVTFNYRPLYIDMEEELKEYEKKLQEKEILEKLENDKIKNNSALNSTTKSKDVFAKFKNYNKEAGTGRVNTAPSPKNNIPQNRMNVNLKEKRDGTKNEKMLLKENANRYSYQGKFLNFNILQKVDKKMIDKKYNLTFADFKKMKTMKFD
jgi:hypothetical protein